MQPLSNSKSFSSLSKEILYPLAAILPVSYPLPTSPSPFPPPSPAWPWQPLTSWLSVSTNLPILDILHKWNHTVCVTFFLSSRTSESESGNVSILTKENLNNTSVMFLDWICVASQEVGFDLMIDLIWFHNRFEDDRFISPMNGAFQGGALLFRIISVVRGRTT